LFITLRSLIWAASGIPVILILGSFFNPIGITIAYNIFLISVILIDFSTAVKKDRIRVIRKLDNKLSLGTKNAITFEISNLNHLKSRIWIKDEVPLDFDYDTKPLKLEINGFEQASTSYDVVPLKRGQYEFGKIHIRTSGILGIAGRQFRVDADEKVKVYPNIKDISTYRLLARKNKLLEVGLKPSRIYGIGTDFEYLREYQPDDEYRKINWKASARRSRLITSQYQTERSQNIFIVLEAGRMMTSQVNRISKFDYALNAALLLAYVAMDKGDNVGLMVFSDEIKLFLPPKRGKKQLNLIIESLYKQEPALVEPDYGKAIRYLAKKNKKRSLVVFFTDLIDIDSSKAVVLYSRSLYPNHLPMCVTMSEPIIINEADQQADDINRIFNKAVAEDLIYQREQVKSVLNRGGVITLDVPPGQLTPELITKYLSIKAKNRL
jgi:uncharacterized protein (DUF58 family)